jgi:hypothetical protein
MLLDGSSTLLRWLKRFVAECASLDGCKAFSIETAFAAKQLPWGCLVRRRTSRTGVSRSSLKGKPPPSTP